MLDVAGIRKSYGGVRALRDLDFTIRSGEMVGLIGPNGSGKSTCFDCITGLVPSDAGQVVFGGEEITDAPVHTIARMGLVRSFQKTVVFRSLTVEDNLMLAGQHSALPGFWSTWRRGRRTRSQEARARNRASEIAEWIGLSHMAQELAGALSYGQQKLVQFGSTLMGSPRLVLLDEPFAGVNLVVIDRMVELIRESHERDGTAFFIIGHNTEILFELVDRVIVLSLGSKIADATPAEVSVDDAVLKAYLGE